MWYELYSTVAEIWVFAQRQVFPPKHCRGGRCTVQLPSSFVTNFPHRNCARACGLGLQCRPNECIFRSGKPQGVGISGEGPRGAGEENGESVY